MKTEYHSRRTLWVSSGFFLALLVSNSPHLYAEERRADSSLVEPIINRNEQPMEPGNTRDTIRPVGLSGEEIHDFLYPTAKDGKVVTLTQLGGARASSEQLSPMVARTDSGCLSVSIERPITSGHRRAAVPCLQESLWPRPARRNTLR